MESYAAAALLDAPFRSIVLYDCSVLLDLANIYTHTHTSLRAHGGTEPNR